MGIFIMGIITKIINIIHSMFLINILEQIESNNIIMYKVFFSVYISILLFLFNKIAYYALPKSEDVIFLVLSINAWFQLVRIIIIGFCHKSSKTVFE